MRLASATLETAVDALHVQQSPLDETAPGEWFVLHVKSRQEKALADDLSAVGISHYLPLICEAKYYGRRKFHVKRPLFAGYLFLRGSVQETYRASSTHRVARILRVADQDRLDTELRNLHLALTKGAMLDVYPFLRNGIHVTVRSGPFRGLQGVIKDRAARDRLILQVDMLGRAASLEIDGALLDPQE